jgi:uncharacterized protein (DUF1501 family)
MFLFHEAPSLLRRAFGATSGAFFAWANIPKFARANDRRDPRLVVLILRGGLDGLYAIGPIGDPDYQNMHGDLALALDGPTPALPLDSFFAVHPSMPNFARLYGKNQALAVHAVATNYREHSHFDGQEVLESGYPGPGVIDSGWLNRAILHLPKGERVNPTRGLAVGVIPPLVMRGSAPLLSWEVQRAPRADDELAARVLDVYNRRDPALALALMQGLEVDKMGMDDDSDPRGLGAKDTPPGMRRAARSAAKLMAADDGPRVAAIAFDGWDTHQNESYIATRLSGLDDVLREFEIGLGDKWQHTVVVAITEFGRTAKINGTGGTDHGTAGVAFLAGGAIKGGRVIADWPGLKDAQLYEQRDLAPTTDLRAVLKGLLADLFGLSPAVLGSKVFPDSIGVMPMKGLVV